MRKWFSLVMVALTVIALAIAANTLVARAAKSSAPSVISERTDQFRREIHADEQSPAISFIDSPSPTCYRSSVGTCYLEWSYLSVSASPSQYIISMTVSINDRVLAYHAGFFQTSMYIYPRRYAQTWFQSRLRLARGKRCAGTGIFLQLCYPRSRDGRIEIGQLWHDNLSGRCRDGVFAFRDETLKPQPNALYLETRFLAIGRNLVFRSCYEST